MHWNSISVTALIVITAVTAVLVGMSAWFFGRERVVGWANISQSVATAIGIWIAGYIFIVERRAEPHADVSQSVEALRVPDSGKVAALEVSISVKNLGAQLLSVKKMTSRLQLLDLSLLGLTELPQRSDGAAYWNSVSTVDGKPGAAFQEAQLRWPTVRTFKGEINHEIEPGETDVIGVSFLIPCPSARYARVASELLKPSNNDNGTRKPSGDESRPANQTDAETAPELYWKSATIVDLKNVCRGG